MGFGIARRQLTVLGVGLLTVFGAFGSLAAVGLTSAGPASASTTGCPNSPQPNTPTDNKVGASFTSTGGVTTYEFSSFVNENSSGGVPGLVEYCVYTTPQPDSSAVDPNLKGADGLNWTDPPSPTFFAFERPDGDPSDIPLDGTRNITMGTATWNSGSAPASQTILLHVNDPAACASFGLTSPTCFVYPGTPAANRDLTVSKTATPSFTRTYAWTIAKNVDNTQLNIAAGGSAVFNYAVAVTHDNGTDSGWTVTGTITVANPNSADFTGVNVTDDSGGGGSCTVTNGSGATVPANGSAKFDYSCTYPSDPGTVTDTATAAWDGTANNTPDSQATGTATADFSGVSPVISDGNVSVTDSLGGVLGSASYTDQNPKTFTYSHTFTGDTAGACTSHDNTATFTTNDTGTTGSASQSVTVCVGADLRVSKDATPSFTRTYTWGIAKAVDNPLIDVAHASSATAHYTVTVTHDNGTDGNWQVTGNITVHNPNSWEPVTLTGVTDAIDNGGSCTVSGDTTQTIPADGSAQLTYVCTYASAPSPPGGTNTATATWDSSAATTPDGSASGTASADFATASPTIVDGSVAVTDTLGGALGTVKYTDPSPATFTYPYTFSTDPAGTCTQHDNTATFTTIDSASTASASQTVFVCIGADLTVAKTATPSFIRTYNWQISKSVTPGTLVAGGTATYTVTATQTGFTDSGWQVTGTITVHNPNDWEPVTLTGVTDAIDNGGSCTVYGNTTQTISAGQDSTGLTYICNYASAPSSSSGTNTATATWAAGVVFTPDGSASGTATADFTSVSPTTVNRMITVSDSYAGVLGTATASDGPIFTTKTFSYTRKLTPPASGCQTVNNTATITETGQNASASVKDCNTGALTMGFWQNKNGQSIITGQASTGVCPSATWLRQYAPFADLSATATCAQVATYVTNIIKAANASGASMNAMLKAQMLATALDVYFSDPALGGNKIGATVPIGGVTIDLTHICRMIDSSSAGTCSGTYENAGPAFNGAASLTISQMLSYAASQSNAGGSAWYGNVKATQQLAKDAFDAINNQVATSP